MFTFVTLMRESNLVDPQYAYRNTHTHSAVSSLDLNIAYIDDVYKCTVQDSSSFTKDSVTTYKSI